MAKKSPSTPTTAYYYPASFRELGPWLEVQLAQMERRFDNRFTAAFANRIAFLEQLYLQRELGSSSRLEAFRQGVIRSLLAANCGQRFLPTLETAMNDYKQARVALNVILESEHVSADSRETMESLIAPWLTRESIALGDLGVGIEEVKPGTRFDGKLHRVAAQVATADESALRTIAKCVQPIFRFRDLEGKDCSRKAEVAVYSELLPLFNPVADVAAVSEEMETGSVSKAG